MKKRAIPSVIVLILLFSLILVVPVTANAQEVGLSENGAEAVLSEVGIPSESQFASSIDSLQQTYVNGQYWNKASSPDYSRTGIIPCDGISYSSSHYGMRCSAVGYCDYCSCECGYFAGGYQCVGFAYKMASLSLGSYPGQSGWSLSYSLGTVNAGDVIRIRNDSHTIFVYKVVGDTIYFADSNFTGPCQVRWGGAYSYSQLASVFTYKWHLSGNTLTGNPVTKPSGAWISANKSSLFIGDSVTFTFGANDATGYTIGINRNGARIITEGVSSGKAYTFNENGNYTAYVSAYNSAGYVDSNIVSFTVKERTPIQDSWVIISGWNVIDEDHHEPILSVWESNTHSSFIRKELVEGTDYTVQTNRYEELHNIFGESPPPDTGYNYKATVTGIGAYSGSVTVYERKTITDDMLEVSEWMLTDRFYQPVFTVKDGDNVLVEDVDYTVTVVNKRQLGLTSYSYHKETRITGIGKYFGSVYLYKKYEAPISPEPVAGDVSGTITSFRDNSAEITVQLYKRNTNTGGANHYPILPTLTTQVTGNTAYYFFNNVEPGEYKLRVNKKDHIRFETIINVDGDTFQDVQLIPDSLLLGDVDGDGEVTIIDATCIQRKLANIATAKYIEAAADTDEDGELTIIDATVIQRWLAQLPTNENIGKPIA